MTFQFSRQGLSASERMLERALEIVPGATSWAILVGMFALSFWQPLLAAMLVIAFDLYWLLRLFYMTLFLTLSWIRLSVERRTDWMAWIREVDQLVQPTDASLAIGWRWSRFPDLCSLWLRQRDLGRLQHSRSLPPSSSQLHHLVIIPIVRERRDVVEPGVRSLAQQTFPARRILVVLALEERASAEVRADVYALQELYRPYFLDLQVIVHPQGLPGEARVKGANATWAARASSQLLEQRGIAFEHVIISCFDADTVVSPEYMACLTYSFMVCPDRTRASFQPIPVYHNNIWDVPGFARVLDIGSSFFQLIEATNPEHLVTFSSHSMSFQALVEAGYWPVDLVSDDSAIFWKAFIHYDGDYRVVPIYVTLSMDIAAAGSWWRAASNVYRQKRRWAWGVENFPIVVRAFLQRSTIPWFDRCRHAFRLFEGHVSWATSAFLLTVLGWVPAVVAGREFSDSVLYH
ncbi:MAG: hypothetical protein COV75_05500, partial [Candidatus Omnitrophica bacterium CG11_big_fil_rev_8_21_14_0_20_63_9]